MRVFCPEHKRGFFAPRQSPVRCENRSHVLGELNFAGDADAQFDLQWQYCCNCEHFCPISPEQDSLQRCPVCTRRSSLLYVCDRCFTISFESNTPVETKNFSLTAEALPEPFCPGCLQANSGEVREHVCEELGASFTTALNSCPICGERLDIGPSFPSLVAQYLRRTKRASKFNVTFDYDTGLFVEVDDGEFVIVTNGVESNQAIVLPRLSHFSSPRDFYEIYQDYYHHHSQLRAGEVMINEPALAERSGDGWKFAAAGLLEVVDDRPKSKGREKIRLSEVETPAEPKPVPAVKAAQQDSSGTTCSQCGSLVEERYAFCWHCGQAMKPAGETTEKRAEGPAGPRRFIIDVDESSTERPASGDVPSSIFSSELPNEGLRRKEGGRRTHRGRIH